MLFSLGLIFILGMFSGFLFRKIGLPHLLGMLIVGIIIGPFTLSLLDPKILDISAELRKIALIIILTRAGLGLELGKLKKVGRPAILMCFLPASIEIIGVLILAPILLGVSLLESLLIGTVLAAVSPAVVVPKMLKLSEEGYGTNKSIPQMIMASASVDDVYVIVLFTAVLELCSTGNADFSSFLKIPTSIIFGLIGGVLIGICFHYLFKTFHIRDSVKVIIILSVSFFLVTIEDNITCAIAFSGLLAIMALGATLRAKNQKLAMRLSVKFSKLWIAAEVLLFVLVGASVDTAYAVSAGISVILLIIGATLFRMFGVFLALIKTELSPKERVFTAFSFMAKATVQAAIGGLALSNGVPVGNTVLTVAVMSIIITAPVGSFLIDKYHAKWLIKE